jgi:hypothetical protein
MAHNGAKTELNGWRVPSVSFLPSNLEQRSAVLSVSRPKQIMGHNTFVASCDLRTVVINRLLVRGGRCGGGGEWEREREREREREIYI